MAERGSVHDCTVDGFQRKGRQKSYSRRSQDNKNVEKERRKVIKIDFIFRCIYIINTAEYKKSI